MPFTSRRLTAILLLTLASCSGCTSSDKDPGPILGFGQRLFNILTGNTAADAVRKMEDPQFADKRWKGVNQLVANPYGKKEPYTDRYMQIAVNDPDWFVRATAVRALNRSRDQKAVDVFIVCLNDPNRQVRLEAAKALANIPDEKAIVPLMKIVDSPADDRDVRIAAADALRHYHKLEVARSLVNTLSAREFGVAWQSRRSLVKITGADFKYDEAAWLAFITGPEKPFG